MEKDMGAFNSKADQAVRKIADASLLVDGKLELSPEELEALWNKYDANKNEELEEEELVHFLSDLRTTLVKAIGASGKEAAVRAADQLNEELTTSELSSVAASILAEMDVNKDGKVTKNEFFEKWRAVFDYETTHVPAAASSISCKLSYFNLRGLGEKIRLLLEVAAIPYEDHRITSEEWPVLKESMPFGQVPQVEITEGDKTLTMVQSNAIVRYIARKAGLSGRTPEEEAKIDMFTEGVEDLRTKLVRVFYSPEFASLKDDLINKTIPDQLANFENLLRGSESGFFTEKLSVADLVLFEVLEIVVAFSPGALDGLEAVSRLHKQVASLPRVAAYLASGRRPTQINGSSASWNPE